jgi:hypothetical protein
VSRVRVGYVHCAGCAAPRRALAARAETDDEAPFRNTFKQGPTYRRL